MNIDFLHSQCKIATRNAFEEYKRQIDVRLFPFTVSLNDNLKSQMCQDIGMAVTKKIINNNDLSIEQIRYLQDTINNYKILAYKVANNYSKKII